MLVVSSVVANFRTKYLNHSNTNLIGCLSDEVIFYVISLLSFSNPNFTIKVLPPF